MSRAAGAFVATSQAATAQASPMLLTFQYMHRRSQMSRVAGASMAPSRAATVQASSIQLAPRMAGPPRPSAPLARLERARLAPGRPGLYRGHVNQQKPSLYQQKTPAGACSHLS